MNGLFLGLRMASMGLAVLCVLVIEGAREGYCHAQEGRSSKHPGMLTVDQTIAMCFTLPKNNLLSAANPTARDYVRRIAMNSKHERASKSALYVLGFIGDLDDVELCANVIAVELSSADANTTRSESAFRGLAQLAERGVGDARAKLERMAVADYWRDKRFDAFRQASGTSMRFESATLPQAVFALAGAGIPSSEALAGKAREAYAGSSLKDWADWRFDVAIVRGHREAIQRAASKAITEDDILHLELVYHSIDPAEIERLGLPKPDPARRPMLRPVPKPVLRELTAEEKQKAADDAKAAFAKLTGHVRKGEYDQVIPRLLHDGLFDDPDRLPGLRDQIRAALKEMTGILLEIDRLKPATTEPVVSIGTDEHNPGNVEVITVTWKLPGTEAIGRRQWKGGGGDETVAQPKTTLIVLMKKKNGVWHWNPYGW